MVPPRVTIRTDVAAELLFAARSREAVNQAGLLLGRVSRGRAELLAYAELSPIESPTEFARALIDDWVPTCRRLLRSSRGFHVMGWVSVSDRWAGELSEGERLVHRTFFNLPHQLTLCVSSDAGEFRAFGASRAGELVSVELHTEPAAAAQMTSHSGATP